MEIYLQIFKTALASGLSWVIVNTWLGWPYPYFAPLASILTVQLTIAESVKKAWQRLLGTIGGVIVSALISQFMSIGAVSIFIVIAVGMTIGSLLQLPPYINSQAAVSSLMVLAFSQSKGYALNRITETIIGSITGILANAFIFPPNAISKAEQCILYLSNEASITLKELGSALEKRDLNLYSPLTNVTKLEKYTIKSSHSIKLAHESLVFNPLMAKKCKRLTELTQGMQHLKNISVQIRGIRRGLLALADHYQNINLDMLKNVIDLTAICIIDFGLMITDNSNEISTRVSHNISKAISTQNDCANELLKHNSPKLTREIGAVMTDLHRILEEVSTSSFTS